MAELPRVEVTTISPDSQKLWSLYVRPSAFNVPLDLLDSFLLVPRSDAQVRARALLPMRGVRQVLEISGAPYGTRTRVSAVKAK